MSSKRNAIVLNSFQERLPTEETESLHIQTDFSSVLLRKLWELTPGIFHMHMRDIRLSLTLPRPKTALSPAIDWSPALSQTIYCLSRLIVPLPIFFSSMKKGLWVSESHWTIGQWLFLDAVNKSVYIFFWICLVFLNFSELLELFLFLYAMKLVTEFSVLIWG